MRRVLVPTVVAMACLLLATQMTFAQKGTGAPTGVARQPVKPAIVSFSGTLLEIKTGLCQATTGRNPVGTHLVMEDTDKKQLNIHLGPAWAVAKTVDNLSIGEPITAKAFRTEKMKENHYVAQSLSFGKTTVTLRDETLRPRWAGSNFRQYPAFTVQGTGRGWRHGLRWRGVR